MFQTIQYVMVTVSDMRKSIAFYKDQLGIPLKFESPEWTEFATGNTVLALHGGGEVKATAPSESKCAGTCSIGFNVADLQATYEELKSKGVRFMMPPTEREGENIKLAVAVDPDGLPISFAEMKTK
jgi:lactoylglutathione lyase